MQFVNYISSAAIPVMVVLMIVWGLKEKIKVFDTFLEGAKEGIDVVIRNFSNINWYFFGSRSS